MNLLNAVNTISHVLQGGEGIHYNYQETKTPSELFLSCEIKTRQVCEVENHQCLFHLLLILT